MIIKEINRLITLSNILLERAFVTYMSEALKNRLFFSPVVAIMSSVPPSPTSNVKPTLSFGHLAPEKTVKKGKKDKKGKKSVSSNLKLFIQCIFTHEFLPVDLCVISDYLNVLRPVL